MDAVVAAGDPVVRRRAAGGDAVDTDAKVGDLSG
jgi:hypothetical protein